jgi:hypothetical protein
LKFSKILKASGGVAASQVMTITGLLDAFSDMDPEKHHLQKKMRDDFQRKAVVNMPVSHPSRAKLPPWALLPMRISTRYLA